MPVMPTIDDLTKDYHWCQWCGLRGSKVSALGMQRVKETLSNYKGSGKKKEPMS